MEHKSDVSPIQIAIGSAAAIGAVLLGMFTAVAGPTSLIATTALLTGLALVIAVLGLGYAIWKHNDSGYFFALLLLAFLSDSTFRTRALSDDSLDPQTLVKALFWVFLIVAAWHSKALSTSTFRNTAAGMGVAFASVALLSASYSLTPTFTIGISVSIFAMLVYLAVAIRKFSLKQILEAATWGLGAITVLSVLAYILLPGKGLVPTEGGTVMRLGGFAGSPNSLGRVAALLLLLLFVMRDYRAQFGLFKKSVFLVFALAAVFCLVAAESRTSTAAFVGATMFVLARRYPRALLMALLCGVFLALLAFQLDIRPNQFLSLVSRSGRASEITTLTGRTDIWLFAIEKIKEAPWLGYGYGSTRRLITEQYHTYWGFTVNQAHNLWLQMLLSVGVTGTAVAAWCFVQQAVACVRQPNGFRDAMLAFVLIHGLTEPSALGVTPNAATLLWILSLFHTPALFDRASSLSLDQASGRLVSPSPLRA